MFAFQDLISLFAISRIWSLSLVRLKTRMRNQSLSKSKSQSSLISCGITFTLIKSRKELLILLLFISSLLCFSIFTFCIMKVSLQLCGWPLKLSWLLWTLYFLVSLFILNTNKWKQQVWLITLISGILSIWFRYASTYSLFVYHSLILQELITCTHWLLCQCSCHLWMSSMPYAFLMILPGL